MSFPFRQYPAPIIRIFRFRYVKRNRHDSLTNLAHAVESSFDLTMANVLRYDTIRIAKGVLCMSE